MSEVGLRKSELDTPALWVDLDVLEQNIATLAAHFKGAGVQWRPHTKGIKTPAIAHKAIAAGAIGVTCAKLGEAEVMAAAGIRDLLVANQVVGPRKIARLVNLCRTADVKIAVDSEATLAGLSEAARAKGVEPGVVIEVDVGLTRCGVAPGEATVALARRVHETPGLRFRGVMAWEGHAISIKDPALKREEIERAVGLLAETARLCREAGLPAEIVSCGGTGTYLITPFLPGVTEIQAGGAIFCDVTYRSWGVQTEPSLFIRSTVVSRPTPERIVFDIGFKSCPGWYGTPEPIGLSGVQKFSMSAEHGTLTLEAPDTSVKVGDAYDIMVGYGDATVFLHDQLYGIRDGVVESVWEIQGRGKLR